MPLASISVAAMAREGAALCRTISVRGPRHGAEKPRDRLRRRGEIERSLAYLRESLAVLRPEDERSFVSRSLKELSKTLVLSRDGELAATLFGAAEALRESLGAAILVSRYPGYERAVAEARRLVGERRFADVWRHGRSLPRDAAIELAVNWEMRLDLNPVPRQNRVRAI